MQEKGALREEQEGRVFIASDNDRVPPVERQYYAYERVALDADFQRKLRGLRTVVDKRYEEVGLQGEKLKIFSEHNQVVLGYAQKLLEKFESLNIPSEDVQDLLIAVTLHDLTKADTPLVKHGWEGAKEAGEMLTKRGYNKLRTQKIVRAIERHMGPIPGFMSMMRDRWNGQHPDDQVPDFPRPETLVDQMLHDADMLGLIDRQGIDKVLIIRETEQNFRKEDEALAAKRGVTREQVAWESALQSAKEASASLCLDAAKELARESLEQGKQEFVKLFNVLPVLS